MLLRYRELSEILCLNGFCLPGLKYFFSYSTKKYMWQHQKIQPLNALFEPNTVLSSSKSSLILVTYKQDKTHTSQNMEPIHFKEAMLSQSLSLVRLGYVNSQVCYLGEQNLWRPQNIHIHFLTCSSSDCKLIPILAF